LKRESKNIDALFYAGLAHCRHGQFPEAVAVLKKVVALAPRHPAAHNLLGLALKDLGRPDDALKSFDRALALNPGLADAHRARADTLMAAGRWAEAVAAFDRLLATQPDIADAWFGRGLALGELDRSEHAIASYDRALALQPAFAAAYANRGTALRKLQRLDDAVADYDRALTLQPDIAEIHFGRGAAREEQGRFADAIASFDRALALRPPAQDAAFAAVVLSHRAWAANQSGYFDQAFADAERSVALAPDHDGVLFQTSFIELLHGRWRDAWPKYERRFRLHNYLPAAFSNPPWPRWQGESLDGERLLLVTEQGLGDAIQFAGFASALARRGFRITLFTSELLAPLLATTPGIEAVATAMDQCGAARDIRWCPLLSVPALLDATPETIADATPHLAAEPERVAAWRDKLGTGLKIGIAWQGNMTNPNDLGRSVPLSQFAPLAAMPNVRLISLQKGSAAAQIAEAGFGDRFERLPGESDVGPQALLDTAAVMANLDLVVTSDSMLAHLAGALRRPAFVALRQVPDWRWLLGRDDSPWYPTMRLFRQTTDGDWGDVFARIAAAVNDAH
jgi:tetratricopeptide (TPR) repeat protein